jgi:hypothetical protein
MHEDKKVFAVCYDYFKEIALYYPNFLPVTTSLYELKDILSDMGVNSYQWLEMVYHASAGCYTQYDLALVDYSNNISETELDLLIDISEITQARNNLILKWLCWELQSQNFTTIPVFGSSPAYVASTIRDFSSEQTILKKFIKYLENSGISASNLFDAGGEEPIPATQGYNAIELQLIKAKVIDTSNLQWSQIREIRLDPEMQRKLRNFRLCIYDNLQGKSHAYVHDYLSKKFEEYESGCRQYGLELIDTTVNTLLDSKSAYAAVLIATAGILLHEPRVVEVSALAGATIEIGKLSFKLAPKLHAYRSMKHKHELAYLIELKKRGSPKQAS